MVCEFYTREYGYSLFMVTMKVDKRAEIKSVRNGRPPYI